MMTQLHPARSARTTSRIRQLSITTSLVLAAAAAAQAQTPPDADPQPPAQPSPNINPDRSALAENVPAASPTQTPPPFKLFRYEEDYAFLQDPARRTHFTDPIKYIPFTPRDPDAYLSIGGEIRGRYEYFSAPAFGLRTDRHDDFALLRLALHTDFRTGPRDGFHFRGFGQLISGWAFGAEIDKPPNQDNELDLQQLFGDLIWGDETDASKDSFRIRAGRQEMGFGSYRLVTSREATNARLTFDGLRLTGVVGGVSIDAFLTRPVSPDFGVFDDESNDRTNFWGVYSTIPIQPQKRLSIDVYYLGLDREQTRFQSGTGDELRHSIGARLWGRASGWDYDAEAVFQFGEFDRPGRSEDILAWTVASNTGYTFQNAAWKPRIGLKLNVASGDNDPADGTLGTFNPLFPRNDYFSQATLLAPYNFFDVHPSLQLRPTDDILLTVAYDAYFRYDTNDAIFGPTGIVVPAGASDSRYVGGSLTLQADWTISRHASFTAAYVHFAAGDAVKDAGGEDVDYFGTWLTLRF